MNTKIISYEARRAIQVGYKNHWRFRVVGQGEVPVQPFYKDEWVFEPVNVPQVAQDRIETLKRFGFSFKGFVIAHEAPRLLPAPAPKKQDFKNNQTVGILPDVEALLGNLLKGLLFFLTFIFQVALLDPALIVVLEDGTWLEVMTWYE
ncbi:MAG: hypothetical protein JNM46_00210 [Anaerolineales bacterium]|nr:hypothetical protein [Anaerolineales bacterium]